MEIELDSLINHAYAEKLKLARTPQISIHFRNNLWHIIEKRSQTYWPAHIRKPDGKVKNLALGPDDAFQILGSVIRDQFHKFSDRGEKWLHIKNWVEHHHISHQAGKERDKCKWWTHTHAQLVFISSRPLCWSEFILYLGLQRALHFPSVFTKWPLIEKLVSFSLYHGKLECWHQGGRAGEELNDVLGS